MTVDEVVESLAWINDHFHIIRAAADDMPTIDYVLERARITVLRQVPPPWSWLRLRSMCLLPLSRLHRGSPWGTPGLPLAPPRGGGAALLAPPPPPAPAPS